MSRWWPPRVQTLLLGMLSVVLALPILSIGIGRVWDDQLINHTEEVLISEAVVVGETYRRILGQPEPEPKSPAPDRYRPFLPVLDLHRVTVQPRASREGSSSATTTPEGAELSRILRHSLGRNLSGVRVLDTEGRVIASPLPEYGYSLANLPEVQSALRGEYGAAVHRRVTDDPNPPLAGLARASLIRVSIAIPIYVDPDAPVGPGPVLGVVYDSRTPIDLGKSVWLLRHELLVPAALSVAITLLIVVLLSLAIAGPIGRVRRTADRIARGERGIALSVRGFAPDEVHALSAALEAMRKELESQASYIKDFAANAAHELKTPLTSLRGAAELLLDAQDTMAKEQERRFLENIHEDALRMDRLVGRLLHLARIEAGRPTRETIDLRAFLGAIAERYGRRGHPVEVRYLKQGDRASLAPDQIESLLTNLLDNAIHHGPGAPIRITLSEEAQGLLLSVRDHGPAKPKEHFDRLFERFYTTERDRGGTGLGLSIVRAVAEAHGGRAWVVRHDDGAEFLVELHH
jgi:signal transduction histidine kinase